MTLIRDITPRIRRIHGVTLTLTDMDTLIRNRQRRTQRRDRRLTGPRRPGMRGLRLTGLRTGERGLRLTGRRHPRTNRFSAHRSPKRRPDRSSLWTAGHRLGLGAGGSDLLSVQCRDHFEAIT